MRLTSGLYELRHARFESASEHLGAKVCANTSKRPRLLCACRSTETACFHLDSGSMYLQLSSQAGYFRPSWQRFCHRKTLNLISIPRLLEAVFHRIGSFPCAYIIQFLFIFVKAINQPDCSWGSKVHNA